MKRSFIPVKFFVFDPADLTEKKIRIYSRIFGFLSLLMLGMMASYLGGFGYFSGIFFLLFVFFGFIYWLFQRKINCTFDRYVKRKKLFRRVVIILAYFSIFFIFGLVFPYIFFFIIAMVTRILRFLST